MRQLLDKAAAGARLTPDEGLQLLQSHDLAALGGAADAACRRLHREPFRTYNIDRNINYTNICTGGCRFCAFSRKAGDADAYVITREELFRKIQETLDVGAAGRTGTGRGLAPCDAADRDSSSETRPPSPHLNVGGDQILLQGGMHPELTIDWYEELLRDIRKQFPQINIHGFSPPEIDHIATVSGLPIERVLLRLKEAGLGSLPGGGAEILVDRVRQAVSPCKASADRWIDICRAWHLMGGSGSATMMFGHVETLADRIEHLERLRRLQDETGGFTAFICWTFQPGNTQLSDLRKAGAFDYLATLAVSRLYLDNFANLQAELGHAGAEDRANGPAVRGQRHGQLDDRRERSGGRRHAIPCDRGQNPPRNRRRGLHAAAEKRVLSTR